MSSGNLHRNWNALAWDGEERFSLETSEAGIRAQGSLTGTSEEGVDFEINYLIELSPEWEVQHVLVSNAVDEGQYLDFTREGGKWVAADEISMEGFDGADYVDISLTPFTNTLPIKRLHLEEQESQNIEVLFIDVPAFEVRRMSQTYTRLGKNTYRYQDADFSADLVVDDDGLVVIYPGLFCEKYHADK